MQATEQRSAPEGKRRRRLHAPARSWRTRWLPLALSLTLHAGLLLLALTVPAPERQTLPTRSAETPESVEIDLVAEAVPKLAEPAAQAPQKLRPPRAPRPRAIARAEPPIAPPARGAGGAPETGRTIEKPPSEPGSPGARQPGAEQPSPGTGGLAASDAPRSLVLTPSPDAWPVAPSGNGGGALGYTLRNDGSSSAGPGPEQIARQAEADRKRIDGWIEDDLAGARASTGMVHDYLGKLRLALQEKASDPKMLPSNPVESFAMAWGAAAQSYANTGNPYSPDAIPEPRPQTSATSALMRQAELWRGGPQDQLVRQEEQARLLREFADGSTGLGLVAIIDIRQAASGEVLALELSQSSGSLPFDQHVLQIAPLAVGTLPAPSADLLRGRDSIRTQWSFEGRITYWRRLDELDRPGDFAYLAALGLVSMAGVPVTGRYDLQSSPMVTDYRNPHFACSVKLLRVY